MSINISNLSKAFHPSRNVLSDITTELPSEDITLIIGENGSGKSTLLNCIAGLLTIENGTIDVRTQAVTYNLNTNNQQISTFTRKGIGYIFQQKALWHHFTIIENIVHPLINVHRFTKENAYERAKEYLERLQLDKIDYKKYPNQLSGGQQRKVAIARTFSIEPELLIIDELEANLDQSAIKLTLDIIENVFLKQGKTILIASHGIDLLERFSPNILLLHDGKVAKTAKGIGELLGKDNNVELTKIIKKSVDSSSRRWFIANQSLKAAIEISRLSINEKDTNKLLTEMGIRICKLVTRFDPDGQHLLMIAVKIRNSSSSSDIRISCAEKTQGFILNGKEVEKLGTLLQAKGMEDGNSVYEFKPNHREILEGSGIKLQIKESPIFRHSSLIDMMFDNNGQGLSYKFSDRHPEISGAYNINVPIPDGRDTEKQSYYEFSKETKNVYLVGCMVDNEIKGIISIDTYSEEKWTNFIVQQLILIGNMVAIAIKNHEFTDDA